SEPDSARPVLLFIHGGGFTSGDKLLEGTPFYDNVGLWAVENGFIGVTMTYRLAPEHQWPAAVEDVAQAVAWLRGAIAGRGGDPERLFVMGHSAGAVHAASYVARPEFHPEAGSGVAGAILVSGIYNIATSEDAPILETYYGTDRGTFADRSTVPHFGRVGVPVMVAVGEYDPPDFTRQALELVRVLFDRDGRPPRFVRAHGHNHYTEIMAFNLPYSPELARQILDFVNIDCSQSYK
ncbi:MAG: alpha/beta hydrolase, partial [Bauldia litoralis]